MKHSFIQDAEFKGRIMGQEIYKSKFRNHGDIVAQERERNAETKQQAQYKFFNEFLPKLAEQTRKLKPETTEMEIQTIEPVYSHADYEQLDTTYQRTAKELTQTK